MSIVTAESTETLDSTATSSGANDDLHQKVSQCIPVLQHVERQLSDTSGLIESSIVDICAQFRAVAESADNNVSLTRGLLGAESSQSSESDHGCQNIESLIKTIRHTVGQVSNKVSETGKASQRGNGKIHAVQNDMRAIDDRIVEVQEIFSKLNVLGLNAGIEAARAGHHGAAFGVIALETRQLSQQAADTSQAIKQTVDQLNHGVDETAQEFDAVISVGETLQQDFEGVVNQLDGCHAQLKTSIETSTRNGESLASDVNALIVDLQFQDRVTQQVQHLIEAIVEIKSTLAEYADENDGLDDSWVQRLIGRCTMQSERQLIDQDADDFAVGEVVDDGVELF